MYTKASAVPAAQGSWKVDEGGGKDLKGKDPVTDEIIYVKMDKRKEYKAIFHLCEHCGDKSVTPQRPVSLKGGTRVTKQTRFDATVFDRYAPSNLSEERGDDKPEKDGDDWTCYWSVDKYLYDIGQAWKPTMTTYRNLIVPCGFYPDRYKIRFNDISRRDGPWPKPENQYRHGKGLEIDVAYFSTTGGEFRFGIHPIQNFDSEATVALLTEFCNTNKVEWITCDPEFQKIIGVRFMGISVSTESGHYHHFHIRFVDPDGLNN